MPDVTCLRRMGLGSEPRGLPPAPRRHARSGRRHRSWHWQSDHETSASDRVFAFGAGRSGTIFGPDASAMRLDDLLGDRQAEPGVLAKALMRPISVEALEDSLQRVLANARTVVIDHDFNLGSHAPADDAHFAAPVGKRVRDREKMGAHLAEAGMMAGHREGVGGAAAFKADICRDVMAEPGFVGNRR